MRAIPAFLAVSLALAAPAAAQPVTIEDVRFMAFDKGIVTIEEVELDDGIWKVEGTDASGHEIKMKVEAGSGRIIKLERD
jgi:hypothetical protein